jgi:predicted GIY-YIG superfamily endonuclease
MASTTGTIYLLHLEAPVNPRRPARHYLGITDDLPARLALHASGRGAKMLAAAVRRGIGWEVARTWPDGDRALERRLKRWKNAAKDLCPVCRRARRGVGR